MANPYKVLPFTIASGATESSVILLNDDGPRLAISRIDITGALTAQTAWLEDSMDVAGTHKALYDENGVKLTFVIGGDRAIRLRPSDYTICKASTKVVLTGAASGAVSGKIFFREA
jgi:hypothetical protein